MMGRRRMAVMSGSPRFRRSIVEPDVDRIAAQAEGQALALRLELHDDAGLVLEPDPAIVRRPDGDAHAPLGIGAGELADIGQVIDIARRRDLREAEAADAEAADGEGVDFALEVELAAAEIAAADEGDLGLLDLDGPRGLLIRRE